LHIADISSFGLIWLLAACLAVLFLLFLAERIGLEKRRRAIRLRVAVTGTRGKSSVTRLVASVLREAGYKTLAKTTGSKPMLILPDGTEKDIQRAGRPSILEQKKILKLAARMGVEAIVCEMMSIKPECLRAESRQFLRPHVLLITNVRLDHVEDMGGTKPAIAKSMAEAVSGGSTVLVPEEECYPAFLEAAERVGASVELISRPPSQTNSTGGGAGSRLEFEENQNLALAVADFLKVDRETARRGIEKSIPDFGSLKVWQLWLDDPDRTWHAASLFAANG